MRIAAAFILTALPATAFAWPVQAAGTLDVSAGLSATATVDLELRRNQTLTATIELFGVTQTLNGTWTRDPRGIMITVPNVVTIYGAPQNGCITGQNTQPTPAFAIPLGATRTMDVAWDICVVP